jgi:hypothetical protein
MRYITYYISILTVIFALFSCQEDDQEGSGENTYFEILTEGFNFEAYYANICCDLSDDQLMAYKNRIANQLAFFKPYNLEEMGWVSIDENFKNQCLGAIDELTRSCVAIDLRDVNQNLCRKSVIGKRKEKETCSIKNGNLTVFFVDVCEAGLTCVETGDTYYCEKGLQEGDACTRSYDRCLNSFECINGICTAEDETVEPISESTCNNIKSNL